MAILRTSNQWSAATAKSRLKQVTRDQAARPAAHANPEADSGPEILTFPANNTGAASATSGKAANKYPDRLSEVEQRQLLLQTVAIYKGWHLVSMQHRPESDVLIAQIVRDNEAADPVLAIREGRAMQIIMDAVGDLKVQHPRADQPGLWVRMKRGLTLVLGSGA